MNVHLPSNLATEEQQRIQRNPRGAESHAVKHADESNWLHVIAGLFLDFLDHDFRRGVPHVAPTRGGEPVPRVGALDEEQLAFFVSDRGTYGDLRRLIARDTCSDFLHPFGYVAISV